MVTTAELEQSPKFDYNTHIFRPALHNRKTAAKGRCDILVFLEASAVRSAHFKSPRSL
jgi:hypothetical protein